MTAITPLKHGIGPQATTLTAERPRTPHVLLVEDDSDTRELLDALLRMEGYLTTAAADPSTALAAVEGATIDVAVIDLRLPGMSGIELLRQLRRRPKFRPRLIVALTGSDEPSDRREARQAGFTDYLVKPIALERLFDLLDAAVA